MVKVIGTLEIISFKFWSVILEKYLLYSRGQPVVVRLGEHNLKSDNDGAQPVNYAIKKIFRHPDYNPPAKYNDIALLKLDRKVQFTKFIQPACLYTNDTFRVNKTVATGWGSIDYGKIKIISQNYISQLDAIIIL